ncbi:unnamed protein product [Phytomonas sp. EM1]|nr:unnamed protein product [Phytomonas sp. EM1]|eukprot:CCW65709.1 unnamed protein product [Phytomonas sp. isolate EM1]
MKHYVSKAAMRSREISQTLIKNLEAYHTLHSLLGNHGSCDEGGGKKAGTYPSAINLASRDGSIVKFQVNSSHVLNPMWKSIDNTLNAAASFAIRHSFESHFATTMASIGERSSSINPFTVSADQYSQVDSNAHPLSHLIGPSLVDAGDLPDYASSPFLAKASIESPDALAEEIFISAWTRDHQDATPAQIQQRLSEWRKDQMGRMRLLLRQEVCKLHQELEEQREMAGTSGDEIRLSMPLDLDGTLGKAAVEVRDAEKAEAHRQRSMWKRFIEDDPVSSKTKLLPMMEVGSSELGASSLSIVKDYAADRSVTDWLRGRGWIHRTHLHEAAALLIQCVFRGYSARRKAQRLRVARFLAFKKTLKTEEETKRQWEVSLKIFEQGSSQVQSTRRLNALLFFENKMSAIISMRRTRNAARAASEAEVVNFAATSIQRVYRGHRARRLVYGMRHPEWLAEVLLRRQTQAALRIQTVWRSHHVRSILRRRHKAAWVIQRAYRFHCARALLTRLRLKLKRKSVEDVRIFAIQIIVRFLKRCCSKRRTQKCHCVKAADDTDQEMEQTEEKM